MKVLFAFFILATHGSPARGQQILTEVPEDFPLFTRFSVSPFYYSTGLQLGNVLSVRRERPILSTFEGELNLGIGSTKGPLIDRGCVADIVEPQVNRRTPPARVEELTREASVSCEIFRNPWRFSFLSTPLFERMSAIKDRPVVIYFINYYVAASHILMRTTNMILDAYPVSPNLPIEPVFRISSWARMHPEAGFITGRVVRASLENSLRRSYEIVIQESQNTNNFRTMSIADHDLFRYITHAMLTGKLLRLEYIRQFRAHAAISQTIWTYMTAFRIIGVEVMPHP